MNHHFQDYYWKNGKPYGKQIVDASAQVSYKIIVDPYYKRFSIEKYRSHIFDRIIYDSFLLDFRHLKPNEQIAWEKEELQSGDSSLRYLLRNQDDRAILTETHNFEQGHCRSCLISSIHGIPLSLHRLYYTALGDPFNGVALFDMENRPVMVKKYEIDPVTDEFTTVTEENWNMETLDGNIALFKSK